MDEGCFRLSDRMKINICDSSVAFATVKNQICNFWVKIGIFLNAHF